MTWSTLYDKNKKTFTIGQCLCRKSVVEPAAAAALPAVKLALTKPQRDFLLRALHRVAAVDHVSANKHLKNTETRNTICPKHKLSHSLIISRGLRDNSPMFVLIIDFIFPNKDFLKLMTSQKVWFKMFTVIQFSFIYIGPIDNNRSFYFAKQRPNNHMFPYENERKGKRSAQGNKDKTGALWEGRQNYDMQ